MKYIAAAAILAASSTAMAGFEAQRTGFFGLGSAIRVDTTGYGGVLNDTFTAGQWEFTYTDVGGDRGLGQFGGGSFGTFCIELQSILSGSLSYDIDDIENAPNPSAGSGQGPYDAADQAEVSAVVAAAIDLGWINSDLSNNGMSEAQAAAIQGMIWKVVFDNADVTAARADVATEMAALQAQYDSNPSGSVDHLRAMLNADSQDQLFVVPLPTAAFAGLLTLGGLAGVKRLRRG